jgi:hypothetical protein
MPRAHLVRFALAAGLAAASLQAASTSIGTIVHEPASQASGLSEADSVTGGRNGSEVRLDNGGTIWLGRGARAVFHRDRMVLERGGANLQLADDYQILAGRVTLHPRGASTVTVALLDTGHVALALWSGAMRVLAGADTLLESCPPGRILEVAMAMPPSQSPGSPGGGTPGGPGRAGPGGCQCQVCLQGNISTQGQPPNQKVFITDDLRGCKVELPVFPPGCAAIAAKNGGRVAICANVDQEGGSEGQHRLGRGSGDL